MKRTFPLRCADPSNRAQHKCKTAAICTLMAFMLTGLTVSSCIYERPHGDNFYRTLWEADQPPLEGMTIEFLCGGGISAKAESAVGTFGTYTADGSHATFSNLSLEYERSAVILEGGYKDKDTMTVMWHYLNSDESNTTIMYRLSEYR